MAVKALVHNSKWDKCCSIFTRHGELNSAPKGQIILYRNFAHLIFASCVHISKVNDLKTTWSATHVESYIYWCTITTGSYIIFERLDPWNQNQFWQVLWHPVLLLNHNSSANHLKSHFKIICYHFTRNQFLPSIIRKKMISEWFEYKCFLVWL